MLGNSLLHDKKWMFSESQTVNCAVQGLTLQKFLPLFEAVPPLVPDVIVVAFGTVEVVQADRRFKEDDLLSSEVNTSAFRKSIHRLLDKLKESWPDAKLIINSVPPTRKRDWQAPTTASQNIMKLNQVILDIVSHKQYADIHLIDLSSVLDLEGSVLSEDMTYDGIHLTKKAYQKWFGELRSLMRK